MLAARTDRRRCAVFRWLGPPRKPGRRQWPARPAPRGTGRSPARPLGRARRALGKKVATVVTEFGRTVAKRKRRHRSWHRQRRLPAGRRGLRRKIWRRLAWTGARSPFPGPRPCPGKRHPAGLHGGPARPLGPGPRHARPDRLSGWNLCAADRRADPHLTFPPPSAIPRLKLLRLHPRLIIRDRRRQVREVSLRHLSMFR